MKLFIAYRLPDRVLRAVLDLQATLRAEIGRSLPGRNTDGVLRCVKPDKLHLTLLFIGETDAAGAKAICTAFREVVGAIGPGDSPSEETNAGGDRSPHLAVTGLGAFPDHRKPRVIWAGAHDPTGTTNKLAVALRRRLSGTDGIPAVGRERGGVLESRPFIPHITIAYPRRRLGAHEWSTIRHILEDRSITGSAGYERHAAEAVPVPRIAVMESVSGPAGARYEEQASFVF